MHEILAAKIQKEVDEELSVSHSFKGNLTFTTIFILVIIFI
jgi:hypothetical protein